MEIPPPTPLVRQTNERRPPELSPAEAAVISAEQWGYHEAHVKRMAEKTHRCWLVEATEKLDAKSVAILRKEYADMFECENPQWKVKMDQHIAKARELEKAKSKDAKDAEVYFRSSFDTFETKHD